MSRAGELGLGQTFDGVLVAARAGEEWAWRVLYRRLAPQVRGYLRARDQADADDLTGEVFVQVVRDLAKFDGGERAFHAWVMTIAHHRWLDERRRRARRPVAAGRQEELSESLGGDVEHDALARMGNERVRRALARLSDDQRSVILLRVIGDLTVEQVADAMGKSPGAVKALQRRGLEALKREFPSTERTLMKDPHAGETEWTISAG